MTESLTVGTGSAGLIRRLWSIQLLRFLVVGGLNTVFGFVCYAVLVWAGLDYVLAVLLSTVIGVLFNFRTTGRLVFGSSDYRLIVRFFLVYIVQYGSNIGFISVLVHAGIGKIPAGAILVIPMALLSFVLQRKFVFTR